MLWCFMLCKAVEGQQLEAVRRLLAQGVDPNAVEGLVGYTSLAIRNRYD